MDLPPLVHLQNLRLSTPKGLSETTSLWLDPAVGKVIALQDVFLNFARGVTQIDLHGDIVAPGYIECQINGAYGVDLGVLPARENFPSDVAQRDEYLRRLQLVADRIVETGVTSFVPTVMSQPASVYPVLLPLLTPRTFDQGASVLGFHAEGPFLAPSRKGCHPPSNLLADASWLRVQEVYGTTALEQDGVKIFTVAPELDGALETTEKLASLKDSMVSIGHSEATYVQALAATIRGAQMITHLFNAMPPLHHRDPGIVGLLSAAPAIPSSTLEALRTLSFPANTEPVGQDLVQALLEVAPFPPTPVVDANASADGPLPSLEALPLPHGWESFQRPFWGLIADGVHVHPSAVKMAYGSHPEGCVLTTDCLSVMDQHAEDGVYPFRPTQRLVRKGTRITLEGSSTLVGSAVDMATSVANLSRFAGVPLHEAIACATVHPAQLLGGEVQRRKGRLERGWDGDLVVLDEQGRVKATWVAGVEVYSRSDL